jgi:dihydroxyacetone synthase
MEFVIEAVKLLEGQGYSVRIVSFPCQRLFEQQNKEYREQVLRRKLHIPIVVVEAYASLSWERYADGGFHMKTFGKSLPGRDAYEFFGFTARNIADKIDRFLKEANGLFDERSEYIDFFDN